MNLASDPWLPVLTTEGMRTLGLVEVLDRAGTVADIATGDPLEDAAVLRLLLACALAAAAASAAPAEWVHAQRRRFELFDPLAPFWQNPDMARFHDDPKGPRPIATISHRLVGVGSAALGHSHNGAGLTLTAAQAARVLLVRHLFSVGGAQPIALAAYGKNAVYAKKSIGAARPLVWIQGPTLRETLALSTAGLGRTGLGRFRFGWPHGVRPGASGSARPVPAGVLDALTWQSRSVLLLRDRAGLVDRAMLCAGLSWPDLGAAWSAADDQRCVPHTTFARAAAAEPYTAHGVAAGRPAWRQLLTAWADPEHPGILRQSPPAGATLRLTGLASLKSRIDGPVTGALPVPVFDRATGRVLLETISDAYRTVEGTARSLAAAMLPLGSAQWSTSLTATATAGFGARLGEIVTAAAAGHVPVDDARADIRATAGAARDTLIETAARVRPAAAARAGARR